MTHLYRVIPAAAAACLLASCGGGGGSPPVTDTPPVTSSSGVAVDGYLQFATVLCDVNGNGVADAGERGAGTDAAGRFGFSPACDAPLVVTGGTNADTGLPFTGTLRAPAGATVVSPLTTLLAEGLAAADLLAALGLPDDTSLATTDPAATTDGVLQQPELYRATLALQQIVQGTASVLLELAGVDDAATQRAVYAAVARAAAAELAADGGTPPVLRNGTTVSPSVVDAIVQAAVSAVAGIAPPTPAVNAATLAQVVAGSLALQAERILGAGPSELTAVVADAQRSTVVGDFVRTNAAQLSAAPGDGSAALAATLVELVDPYLAIAGDSLRLVNGNAVTALSLAAFASADGISVPWPLAEPLTLEVTLARAANYTPMAGQKLSAAVSMQETTAGGQGSILALIDGVDVARVGDVLRLTVPSTARARVYGVSTDGRRKAVVDFANGVRNVTGSFETGGNVTSFPLGNIVNYAINQLSNDFTGIYALRGSYRVSLVLAGLDLRHADGSRFEAASLTVPTGLNSAGAVTSSVTVEGRGLTGTITLVD
ncbi:hypothetical protein [Rubrivivax albus]|uniref:Carboxypeptidase regulatory-like domain-containing protein n=1 Tax=Rubrivivax albus TaxID=2499835 RepID=A0A3S2TJL1_9BURK|nr:hypothetical protein [Rubrivivax albus]RVT48433.1 hypothetical protein ENE75_22330 [Rubrivivax albus]